MIIRSLQEPRGSRFSRLSITLRLKYILPKLEKFSVYFRTVVQGVSLYKYSNSRKTYLNDEKEICDVSRCQSIIRPDQYRAKSAE